MKSFRLDDELEEKLEQVLAITGSSQSELLRRALERECERVLESRLDHWIGDLIGTVESDGGRAERTGEIFRDVLRDASNS